MKVKIVTPCAGDRFYYSAGQEVEATTPEMVERLKDLVCGGHAIEIDSAPAQRSEKAEKLQKVNIEKR